jgi:hypothetical protein
MSGDTYEVGYRKPPAASRFQKGKSGNSKGRPKGARNFSTDLGKELRKKIRVREGESERTVSKQEAVVMAMVARAAKGDTRALNTLIKAVERLEASEPSPPPELDADENAVLAAYEASLLEKLESSPSPQSTDDPEEPSND